MYYQKQYLIIYTGHDEIIPLSGNEIYYYQKELNFKILNFVKNILERAIIHQVLVMILTKIMNMLKTFLLIVC